MNAFVRPARPGDLPALVDIYNHYVVHTHITFDVVTFDIDGRRAWFESFAETGRHRLLVVEKAGAVLGYATSGRHRAKPAYDPSVETTIYLAHDAGGRGLGRLLYSTLLAALETEPTAHRAFAGVALPNDASVALHERLGFSVIGTFHEIGHKFDRTWDVMWFERSLVG